MAVIGIVSRICRSKLSTEDLWNWIYEPRGPTQMGVVVGAGDPAAGSSVMASAAASVMRALGEETSSTRPAASGRKIPALMGAPVLGTTHNWKVRSEAGGGI